jgi:hypothetical protein
MRRLSCLGATSALLGIAAPAAAEPEPAARVDADAPAVHVAQAPRSAPAPARRLSLHAPPPPGAPVQRQYHVHDGFYLRMSVGAGVLNASVDVDSAELADFGAEGGAFALDVLVGASPSPGLAVGGALLLNRGSSGDVEIDGRRVDASTQLGFGLIGAFVDGFPDAKGGFHLGGAVGFAGVGVDVGEGAAGDHNGVGLGGAAWIGWAAWVAPDWSMGADLRFTGAITREEQDEASQDARAGAITLLFTTLYH